MYESLRTRLEMLGQHHFEPDGAERWDFTDGRRVVHREHLTTGELAKCYRSAEALVYPSLFEGFGLPVLEAMSCGCPVVTSWRSPMEEIAGESGWYVDPEDEDSILAGLREVLSSQDRRLERRLAALDRAKAFSFEGFTEGLLSAYLEATSEP
jgi:glycosyltransferase involved in cell wall biosynthesis